MMTLQEYVRYEQFSEWLGEFGSDCIGDPCCSGVRDAGRQGAEVQ